MDIFSFSLGCTLELTLASTGDPSRGLHVVMVIDTPIDRASDRPAYKQIADQLRERLDSGEIKPGDRLPSETELIRTTTMSRATVRRGLNELVKEGRVEARPGEGVFALGPPRRLVIRDPQKVLTAFRSAGDDHGPMKPAAAAQGFDYHLEVLALEGTGASATVARLLDLAEGEDVFVRRRRVWLRRTGSRASLQPAKLADSYIPMDIAVGPIREEQTGAGGVYTRIEEQGHSLTRFEESLEFRMPSPREVRLLQLAVGVPVVDQTRVAFSSDRPVECFRAVLAGDKYEFEYRIPAS